MPFTIYLILSEVEGRGVTLATLHSDHEAFDYAQDEAFDYAQDEVRRSHGPNPLPAESR